MWRFNYHPLIESEATNIQIAPPQETKHSFPDLIPAVPKELALILASKAKKCTTKFTDILERIPDQSTMISEEDGYLGGHYDQVIQYTRWELVEQGICRSTTAETGRESMQPRGMAMAKDQTIAARWRWPKLELHACSHVAVRRQSRNRRSW